MAHVYPQDFQAFLHYHIASNWPEGCSDCAGSLYVDFRQHMSVVSIEGGTQMNVKVDPLVKVGCAECAKVFWLDEQTLMAKHEDRKSHSADVISIIPRDQ